MRQGRARRVPPGPLQGRDLHRPLLNPTPAVAVVDIGTLKDEGGTVRGAAILQRHQGAVALVWSQPYEGMLKNVDPKTTPADLDAIERSVKKLTDAGWRVYILSSLVLPTGHVLVLQGETDEPGTPGNQDYSAELTRNHLNTLRLLVAEKSAQASKTSSTPGLTGKVGEKKP